ncbi:MAG: ankyrin repeat domain-containing protein [Planctomycetaceae bacterium]|nr:ankyrin repeat domain-containing protein [Planctomycetaceae bacterium]
MQKTIFTTLLTVSFVSVLFLTGCGQVPEQTRNNKSSNIQNNEKSESKETLITREVDPTALEALCQYIKVGSLDDVKFIVRLWAKEDIVNARDDNGLTPIHYATRYSQIGVLKFLVEKGADVNAESNDGETPIYVAAALSSKVDVLKFLVEKGADVNVKSNDGKAPLHWAAIDGNLEAVKVLVNAGANINEEDNAGATPIHTVVTNYSKAAFNSTKVDVLKFLVEKGADINTKDKDGDTPLHTAANEGRVRAVKILVNAGANINAKNNKDETPQYVAKTEEIKEILREAGK